MSCLSSLIDIVDPLVLDTSVLIDLRACKYGERILMAIPNDIIVPEIVAEELEHETNRRNGERGFLHRLVRGGIVTLANMTDAEFEIFHEITSTSPSLDDGEAATIAVAAARYLLPVIDERKGAVRSGPLLEARVPAWSLDLFLHPTAIADLGNQSSIEALYLALRDGCMRIPLERTESVIALIGTERSRNCTCLPGYRDRFVYAQNGSLETKIPAIANLAITK